MDENQASITNIVDAYKKTFPEEYKVVMLIAREKKRRFLEGNGKWADMRGDILGRPLLDYPETLWNLFSSRLTPEALLYLTTKDGARWLAKKYPEFALVDKI